MLKEDPAGFRNLVQSAAVDPPADFLVKAVVAQPLRKKVQRLSSDLIVEVVTKYDVDRIQR